ncbi:efflux RND transporter periplasmic adaptor subunit [Fibrobacterales bacterium]|nr:efflux RND transporter periplasmic adaptor subunit [Fibrobacterales bacterium]
MQHTLKSENSPAPAPKKSQGFIKHAFIALTAISALSLTACNNEPQAEVTWETESYTRATLKIENKEVQNYRTASGRIVSKEQVQVASRMMGYITSIKVEEGQKVKKGQVLFSIDPVDVESQVAMAAAGGEQAKAGLADAKADFERFDRLFKDKAVTLAQWEKMRLRYDVAIQQVAAASAGLKMATSQRKYTAVRSPISGVVTRKMASKGNLATPGFPVVLVENPNALEIQTQIPEDVFSQVSEGGEACLKVSNQVVCGAKVEDVVPVADAMSHTHFVRLSLPSLGENQKPWLGGSFVEVVFPTSKTMGVQIPKEALMVRAGIPGVMTVNSKGLAQYRMVRTVQSGAKNLEGQELLEVQAGLKAGDVVVVENPKLIQNADTVVTKTQGVKNGK